MIEAIKVYLGKTLVGYMTWNHAKKFEQFVFQ